MVAGGGGVGAALANLYLSVFYLMYAAITYCVLVRTKLFSYLEKYARTLKIKPMKINSYG